MSETTNHMKTVAILITESFSENISWILFCKIKFRFLSKGFYSVNDFFKQKNMDTNQLYSTTLRF